MPITSINPETKFDLEASLFAIVSNLQVQSKNETIYILNTIK